MSAPVGLRVRCPAKINLGFWIVGRRDDGYHEVDTILQAIHLEDELTLAPAPRGFALSTRGLPIPGGGPNLVERAWDLLRETTGGRKLAGLSVRLTKRIPVGAGLGGGSSDAAGLLVGANELFGLGLDGDALERLAVRLGTDVAFFLHGGTARGTGRGEKLRQLCPLGPFWTLLASPPFAVSTTWAYGQARKHLTPGPSGASVLASAITSRVWGAAWDAMHNVFEDVVLPEFPSLVELKRAVISGGAMKAQLSGSGSTIFGLFRSRDEAMMAAKGIARRGAEVRVARTRERGVTVAPLV